MDIQYNNHRQAFAARKLRFKQLKYHKRDILINNRLEPIDHLAQLNEVNHAFSMLKSNLHNSRFFQFIPSEDYADYLKEERVKKQIK